MTDKTSDKQTAAIITVLLFLLLCLFGINTIAFGDKYCWMLWSIYIHNHGFPQAYNSGTNYMPLLQYVLYVYSRIMGNAKDIELYINYLKVFSIAFDFIGIWYVWKFLSGRVAYISVLLLTMLNIGFIYNSVIWGQFDAVLSTLNFIAVYYALKKDITKACFFFIIALNMKVQAVVLLPVIGVFYLWNIIEKRTWGAALYPVLLMVIVQLFFLAPFTGSVNGVYDVWDVVVNSVDNQPYLSLNAYNLWYLIFPSIDPTLTPDTTIQVAGISSKTAGLAFFCLSSAVALYPLLKVFVLRVGGRSVEMIAGHKVLLICASLYLLFFYFNTQMHERYSHPAFLFIIAYAFYMRKYVVYVLFSLAYFLSLERVMQWMGLKNYHTAVFDPQLLAVLYSIVILILFYQLYKKDKPVASRAEGTLLSA